MKTIHLLLSLTLLFTLSTLPANAQKKSSAQRTNATKPVAKPDTLAKLTAQANAGDANAQNTLGLWYYTGKNVKQDYKQALDWWLKAAKQDHAVAIGNVALCYQLGRGDKKDSLLSVQLYKKSIGKGNTALVPQHEKLAEKPENLYSNALMYELYNTGTGVKRSADKALYYLERTVKGGDTKRRYQLALDYLNNDQPDKAAPYFKAEAQKGNSQATFFYGYLLHTGTGVRQDKEKGITLMTQAEAKGVKAADWQLGRIYYEGDGAPIDYNKAATYLLKAAPNNGKAQWLLARCYIHGRGVKQDYDLAAQWMAEPIEAQKQQLTGLLSQPENATFATYLKGLKQLYYENNPVQALEAFRQVEKAGNTAGTTMTALCLMHSNNPKRNPKKAVKLLEKAAADNATAAYQLALLYDKGEQVKQDAQRAISLLDKAAKAGNAQAQCMLGNKYFSGNGVAQDLTQAARLYMQAEAQRHLTAEAARNLATCYKKRIGILPDLKDADKRIKQLNSMTDNQRIFQLLKLVN